ncbi:unnamed protein product [Urochloa decumbens]|uniref:DUF1618 domain-containing protein n=1 Tax=Urochloa decumbens TaxID=240449 RepID=A0ABC9DXP6_9POAL
MRIPGLFQYSLNPPALSGDDAAAAEEKLPWWVLLERDAYVAKRDNATTAFALTCNGKPIQVTFCVSRPPRVSYVCVHCPDPDEINTEPTVLATEQGFVLLSVTVGREGDYTDNFDYYVYHADGAEGPSLVLLPRPPYPFRGNDAGVLCYRNDHTGGKEYIVAALRRDWSWPSGQFDLCLYDSNKPGHWNVHRVSLSKRHGCTKRFYHKNCKVMAVGGDAGTMAFADLWRGILFCDVLRVGDEAARRRPKEGEPMPLLRYVPVPKPNDSIQRDARLYRNVAVVGGRLKYVQLHPRKKPLDGLCLYNDGSSTDGYIIEGWMATTWSRPAAATSTSSSSSLSPSSSGQDDRWRQDNNIRDLDTGLKVPNNLGFELLPRRPWQPVLGLQDDADDIVYFTGLVRCMDNKSLVAVAAVDMGKKEMLGATAFSAAPRYIDFAYVHGTVSKYLR